MSFGIRTPRGIMLSIREFDSLPDYSCSLPTGTIIGKRWKRRHPYRVGPGITNTYTMGEYVECAIPGEIGIEWTPIILPDGVRSPKRNTRWPRMPDNSAFRWRRGAAVTTQNVDD